MSRIVLRLQLSRCVDWRELETVLSIALAATQALFGAARARLETGYSENPSRRTVAVDATYAAGRIFARILTGLVIEQFGADAVQIEPARRQE